MDVGRSVVGRSLTRSLGRSVARSLRRSVARSLDRSLARSLDRSIARSLGRSIARSLDCSLGRSIARSLARSLDRSLARSIVAGSIVRTEYSTANLMVWEKESYASTGRKYKTLTIVVPIQMRSFQVIKIFQQIAEKKG